MTDLQKNISLEPKGSYKLAILASHFIQYNSPIFREISKNSHIDLEVFYLSDHGLRQGYDEEFTETFEWDIPLDKGYNWKLFCSAKGRQISKKNIFKDLEILKLLRKRNYDAIYLQLDYSKIAVVIFLYCCLFFHTPVLYRGDTTLIHENKNRKKVKRFLLRPIFKRGVWGLFVGKLAKEYIADLGVPETKLVFSPHSVDSKYWSLQAEILVDKKKDLRRELNIAQNRTVILFCGKIIENKRPLDLIYAMEKISHSKPISLLFVGSGPILNKVRNVASKYPQLDVIFTGFVNQSLLAKVYASSDIIVLPSSTETWGLVINEAMYFGCVPIVSDMVGCGPDLVKGIGEIYPVGNIQSLEESIEKVLNNLYLYKASVPDRLVNYSLNETVKGIVKATIDASNSNN